MQSRQTPGASTSGAPPSFVTTARQPHILHSFRLHPRRSSTLGYSLSGIDEQAIWSSPVPPGARRVLEGHRRLEVELGPFNIAILQHPRRDSHCDRSTQVSRWTTMKAHKHTRTAFSHLCASLHSACRNTADTVRANNVISEEGEGEVSSGGVDAVVGVR